MRLIPVIKIESIALINFNYRIKCLRALHLAFLKFTDENNNTVQSSLHSNDRYHFFLITFHQLRIDPMQHFLCTKINETFEMTNIIEKDWSQSKSRYISNELMHQPIFRKSEQQRFFSILLRMQNCKIHGSKRILARFSPFPGFTKINCFASALSLQLSRRTAPFLNYFLQ